jgi:hypothetical protein
MRLRVPPGCGAASHGGFAVDIGADGCVEVEEAAARALRAHGFAACEAELDDMPSSPDIAQPVHDIGRLNRRGLFAFLKAKGVSVSLPITNDELRVLALRAAAPDPSDASEGS